MKHKFEEMEAYRDDFVKVRFIGNFVSDTVETAIMMIPETDKNHRPFINPHNGIVHFRIVAAMTYAEAVAAMTDNLRCLETYGKFINSIVD